jgi:hypothetical protein
VRGETDSQAVLHATTADGFDGQRLAVVESTRPPVVPPPSQSVSSPELTITERSANRVVLAINTPESRFLVLSEMYFPGWTAKVDGTSTEIYRTNYLFRGVVAPPGQHTVTFVYRPTSAILGALVTALAILGAALLLLSAPAMVSSRKPGDEAGGITH